MESTDHGIDCGETENLYAAYKSYLKAIAYRMLGSVSDAEDAVQDMFVSLRIPPADQIQHIKAYLAKVITNRCLNVLKSARKTRETYIGTWLPEPLIIEEKDRHNPLEAVERRETVSYAFMLLLESLAPMERAVYVLREAFDFDYREIAGMVEKSEANCRKIYTRARDRMKRADAEAKAHSYSFSLRGKQEEHLVRRFVDVFQKGNVAELMKLLTEDAVLVSDGGGKVRAAINPIVTRSRVAILLNVLASKKLKDADVHEVTLNGSRGLLFTRDGSVLATIALEWDSDTDEIRRIYSVLNPDKLKHLFTL